MIRYGGSTSLFLLKEDRNNMIYFVNIILLLLMHLVLVNGINGLPKSSEEFIASYTCNSNDVQKLLEQQEEGDFFKWVLAARHTTHQSGWEVNTTTNYTDNSNKKYYARVFDLLNYSRIHNLLPDSIGVDEVCHKGMETQYQHDKTYDWSVGNDIKSRKPNKYIPSKSWANLWSICHKQLSSSIRIKSTCIDIPGVVVSSPSDKANNPCNRKYRMVDGAHRICLRKYLLLLLNGELNELESLNESSNLYKMMNQKQLINFYNQSMFIVINQTIFESMLMDDNPHTTWAQDKDFLMKDITNDLQLDWKEWMGRVMDRVDERKSNITLSTSNQDVSTDEL